MDPKKNFLSKNALSSLTHTAEPQKTHTNGGGKDTAAGEECDAGDTAAGDGVAWSVGTVEKGMKEASFFVNQSSLVVVLKNGSLRIRRLPATEGCPRFGETVAKIPSEKAGDLATDRADLRAPPLLGFEAFSSSFNGGRRTGISPREFNMAEFLSLASRVMDEGDADAMEALVALKSRWERRFGNGATATKQTATMTVASLPHGAGGSTPLNGGKPRLDEDDGGPPALEDTTQIPARLEVRRLPDVDVEVAPVVSVVDAEVAPVVSDVDVEVAPVVSDVDGEVAPVGSDLDAEVAVEVSADVSPTRADVISAARADVSAYSSADVIHCARADVISYTSADVTAYTAADVINPRADISSFMEEKNSNLGNKLAPVPLFIGNIPLHTGSNGIVNDKIADAFNNSSRKTLSFIAPTKQNGEVVVRPSLDTVRDGSKRWKSTAVGYFMGKRPYYHHLKEFAHSVWPALREVIATANGFFFFQFKTEIDMEEVIEGGPWLFQGQPIVLQKWEPGMAMRKLKHTQVPVWIKLRHLPLEFWTTEGLSTVASGVGKPLYPDAITRACTRLDFARVCVMIDVTQKLEKHIIIMTPDEDGGETPCKVDIEYEWLPPKCTGCMTLGHSEKECSLTKPQKQTKPPVKVYVPKVNVPPPPAPGEREKKHKTVVEVDDKVRGDEGTKQNKRYTSSQKEKVWNVRGLNKRDHQLAVKDLISEYRLDFMGILETRVRINNVMHIQSFLLPHWKWFVDYATVGNRIWVAWDENVVDVHILDLGNQFMHCRVTHRANSESLLITIVYGASEMIDRRSLWNTLETLAREHSDEPWLVGGDFNAVREMNEVCGASGDIRMAMEEFNAGIQEAGLIPLPMQGEWYTWHNCSTNSRSLWKRLDRILINDRWLARFPSSCYHSLLPRTSDHSPLVLHGDRQSQTGGMFRFDNYLTHSPEFIPSVQNIWQNTIVGVPMFAVTRKLKALKPVFREQRRKKGDLTLNVQLAKGFLDEAQQLVSSDRQNEAFLQLEHCCRLVYAKAAKLEQIMLQQRAKMQWMKGGDQCSRIFFRKIAQRRVARRILQINDDNGTIHTEPEDIINEFVRYYQNLLGGNRRQITLDIGFLRPWARHVLSNEEAGHLISAFTPDDVKQAVFDIAEDKAPGPDGYSSGFFKAAWPVVGQEVTKAVLEFFSTGKLLKQVNSTLLALIPKVHTPMTVGDFRPISCCNVLYKIIAKLLVQRLSVVLDKIISPCQGAFIPRRSIGDNILLAQELLTGYNQAYDTVEWDFLLAVLQLFGFPQTFTRWIEECVTTAAFSIGLNGNPHGFFTGARGLRQGDPLSPYLFVLVMEVLHLGLLQLIEQDLQFSYHWKCEPAKVFQLGFADDLLLFCRADLDSLRILKRGLDRFAEWSGLRLNVQKSHVIISRSAQGWKDQILAIMGFQEGQLPMRYLGLPLLSSRLSISDCQPLLLNIDARINGWEGISLSYAGRIQIIKSVLSAMSIYWASAFILPKAIIKQIEKRFRTMERHFYVGIRQEGGQGIKDIGILNRSLIAKKLCDVIRCDRTSIWVEWLKQGRLHNTSIWTINEKGGSWGWRKMLRLRSSILPMTEFLIGEGRSFYLWKDPWHHLGPLIARFPRGPSLLGLDESAKLQVVIDEGQWQWPFITDLEWMEIIYTLPQIHGGMTGSTGGFQRDDPLHNPYTDFS
ncbi:UNVERIFIED_CONTAM: hypothetical protein Sindi_3034800, partial [Sesamum indicum]